MLCKIIICYACLKTNTNLCKNIIVSNQKYFYKKTGISQRNHSITWLSRTKIRTVFIKSHIYIYRNVKIYSQCNKKCLCKNLNTYHSIADVVNNTWYQSGRSCLWRNDRTIFGNKMYWRTFQWGKWSSQLV